MSKISTTEEIITKPEVLASDERGVIEKLTGGDRYTTTLRITSKKGTVRANHYHQHDSHLCYLASGKIEYLTREPAEDANAPLQSVIINPGELFYTPPHLAHAMVFLEDSEFYAFTPRSGDQAEYENDVIRVTLVTPDEAQARANQH
jgi:quercetin dioxygenase-like cupin family protein